jgi:hypothetical protein
MKNLSPFRYFKTSPEILRLAAMMYVRYRLSLRQIEDLLFERGIDICRETVRLWWNRFGLLVSYLETRYRRRWCRRPARGEDLRPLREPRARCRSSGEDSSRILRSTSTAICVVGAADWLARCVDHASNSKVIVWRPQFAILLP